jgi:Rap1a immunity proteins
VSAASYAQGFASACLVWQAKLGSKAPFDLPYGLTPARFVAIVQKYLREHQDRLSDRGENLLLEATKSAFPRK